MDKGKGPADGVDPSYLPPREDALLRDLLRATIVPTCLLTDYRLVAAGAGYYVLRAELAHPRRTVAIKLRDPRSPRAGDFARAAAVARFLREWTGVPTYEVLSCDATGRDWPWAYLVTSYLEGQHWHEVAPSLDEHERSRLYRQLGLAVATLHGIRFPDYGAIQPNGTVAPGTPYLDALAAWATTRIPNPAHAALFRALLAERAALFADVASAQLTHEDLNPNNLLVRREGDAWQLAGVLDFDKSWAGCGESDLARLELWRGMMGDGFFAGYTETLALASGYTERRPLYQLLWCLEYARPTPRHNADARAVCKALGIPPVVFE